MAVDERVGGIRHRYLDKFFARWDADGSVAAAAAGKEAKRSEREVMGGSGGDQGWILVY